jgi:lysophospholipase L1-like esterase
MGGHTATARRLQSVRQRERVVGKSHGAQAAAGLRRVSNRLAHLVRLERIEKVYGAAETNTHGIFRGREQSMKKDLLLTLGVTVATLAISLAGIRIFMPQLFGIAPDLQMVRLDDQVPPFYENVFVPNSARHDDGYLYNDPITIVRAPTLYPDLVGMGPNDVLGFRNRSVPNVADVIVIGDSQTYGNNAPLEGNWPSQMRKAIADKDPVVYAMATGGWGAVQYLDMFRYALRFQPRVVIIAFYTGNDPLDSFQAAYNVDQWSFLRVDHSLDGTAMASIIAPKAAEDLWPVQFRDGLKTVFTPGRRLISNDTSNDAARVGYQIMAEVARTIAAEARGKTKVVMTVIPTKELVYAPRLERETIAVPSRFSNLVQAEKRNAEGLAATLKGLADVGYVDVIAPLQRAALGDEQLYPDDDNGHPVEGGYKIIGDAVAETVAPLIPDSPRGLVAVMDETQQHYRLFLVNGQELWDIGDTKVLEANGWTGDEQPTTVTERDLAGLQRRGPLSAIDPPRFGPAVDFDR